MFQHFQCLLRKFTTNTIANLCNIFVTSVILFHICLFFFSYTTVKFTFLIPRLSFSSNFYSLLTEDSMKYVRLTPIAYTICTIQFIVSYISKIATFPLYLSYQCRDNRICL